MNIGHYAGNAIGGAVGGAIAGAAIGYFAAKKGHRDIKKHVIAGAGVFAALAVVGTALGKDLPLVPKTRALGGHAAAGMPYGSNAARWIPTQSPASTATWAPWYSPNSYY